MMGKNNNETENVRIESPVEVSFQVLNELLRQKFQGKILSKGKENGETSDKAKIEKIFLKNGLNDEFPLALKLEIKLLIPFFKNKEVEMLLHLSPEFNPENQEISVERYKIDGLNNGWIVDNLLEGLVNSFLYDNLKNKMKFSLRPLLEKKVDELNKKLVEGIEVKDHIFLSGTINHFRIKKVIFEEEAILAFLDISGNNTLKIGKINF